MIIRLKLLFSVIGSMADLLERMRKEMMSFSIMLVGYSGAGKSSLINRYVQNKFINLQSTTGIDFLTKKLKYKQKSINLELWDTSGQEKYKSISLQRYKRANAMIFVYSLVQLETIKDMEDYWIPTAASECRIDTPFVVFGNKSDLVENPEKIEQVRKIVDEILASLESKLGIRFMHFTGNCKQDEDKGIPMMMEALTEELYDKNIKEQSKIEQEKRLQKQRGILEKPIRKSVILSASDFESNLKSNKPKPKKKCLPF